MRHLVELPVVFTLVAFTLGGCEEPVTSVEKTAATTAATENPETCENVKGTGFISGPVADFDGDGELSASGTVEGDVTGTFTIIRDVDATTQQGNGTTFAFYKEARLETSELGTFTGTAEGNFNIGLGEEGTRSNRAVVQATFDGPDQREGTMELEGPFDFSKLGDGIIRADFRYNARLCP